MYLNVRHVGVGEIMAGEALNGRWFCLCREDRNFRKLNPQPLPVYFMELSVGQRTGSLGVVLAQPTAAGKAGIILTSAAYTVVTIDTTDTTDPMDTSYANGWWYYLVARIMFPAKPRR